MPGIIRIFAECLALIFTNLLKNILTMKRKLLKSFLLAALTTMGMTAQAQSVFNGGFESCTPTAEDQNTKDGLAGIDYEAEGWKLDQQANWCNSAAFAFGSTTQLNGVTPPATDFDGFGGNGMGFTVGWSGTQTYKSASTLTLPAGKHVLLTYVYNANPTAQQINSKLAFVPTEGEAFESTVGNYPSGQWMVDYVVFELSAATEGYVQIGGQAVSGGSGANAKFFIDNVELTDEQGLEDALLAIKIKKVDENAALVEGATATSPKAAPFVVNGTFDSNINGWQRTGTFQNNARANNQQGDFTGYFWENWDPNPSANKMYQTIDYIPNGTYMLRIAAFVNNFADPNNCQFVFANSDKTFLTTGAPTFYEVWTVVSGNTMEIGLEQTEAVANWMGIDNVSLTYYGPGNVITQAQAGQHKVDYDAAKAEAKALLEDPSYMHMAITEEAEVLYTLYTTAEPTTPEGYDEATLALRDAINAFKAAKPAYDSYVAAVEAADVELPYADDTILDAIDNVEEPLTAAAAQAAANTIYKLLRQYYESNALATGRAQVENMSNLIVNNAEPTDTEGWTFTAGKFRILSNESWTDGQDNNTHSYFDSNSWGTAFASQFTQDVELTAGKYLFTAKARGNGTTTYQVIAKDKATDIITVGNTGGIFDRGWNDWSVEFDVTEAKEIVTLGINVETGNSGNWVSFSDFRLVKLAEISTGITDVTNAQNRQAIYNLRGQRVEKAAKGLYIINGKKVVK